MISQKEIKFLMKVIMTSETVVNIANLAANYYGAYSLGYICLSSYYQYDK
jgi:hypothetical protein